MAPAGPFAASVRVAPYDAAVETAAAAAGDAGAVVVFEGRCRSEGGRLRALEIEHYPGMAEAEIGRLIEAARVRWPLLGARVVHRHGLVPAGEGIVLVAVASEHRAPAFEAARFLMDRLKAGAPFWKREHRTDGTLGEWVEAREADEVAAASWA